ncbi:MAG: class I SAM-dependent methyltransferase [Gammaproteobacteria bacterium]|nr:class I SAM-dependent methyltransferase [Gammaproteobacteria bacterium]TVQ48318.1 MAG: methyltransferase [Gammaproteobacteria bacterium]
MKTTVRMAVSTALISMTFALGACSGDAPPQEPELPAPDQEISDAITEPRETAPVDPAADRLVEVLAAQPEDVQARYAQRRPAETLGFFGIEPGMTVAEVLPGGGWYSRILLPYLGEDGQLIGVDYEIEMFRLFGFMNEEQIAAKATWVEDWTATAEGWRGEGDASVAAFQLGALPEALEGSADAVLMIRALHNLARFSTGDEDYLGRALADVHAVLRPGGVVGVVQHEAREDMPDEWASGAAGYLKRDFVVEAFEAAGFELVSASNINANPLDQPTVDDAVWRLPPMLATSRDNPELRAEKEAIGESHRMTLKFRKPLE